VQKKLLLVTSDGGMTAKVAFTTAVLEAFSMSFGNIPKKMQFCRVAKLTSNVFSLTMDVFALIKDVLALTTNVFALKMDVLALTTNVLALIKN